MTAPATSRLRAPSPAGLLAALETVRDPELDEPITALGFVASATVSAAGDAQVRLRLPTYFCAPNFAYLMVADAYDAVTTLPGVRHAEVVLDGHFASDAINGGVAAQAGFAQSFDGEAVGELHQLRADFLREDITLLGTVGQRVGDADLGGHLQSMRDDESHQQTAHFLLSVNHCRFVHDAAFQARTLWFGRTVRF